MAYEALYILQDYLPVVYSNLSVDQNRHRLPDSRESCEHTLLDLGADEFTVGRPHPMLDNELRVHRFLEEAADPGVGVILLDVVLGYGTHRDPAAELAPAIADVRAKAHAAGRHLEVLVALVGTDEDPQVLSNQAARLEEAGARVDTSHEQAVRCAGRLARWLNRSSDLPAARVGPPVDLATLQQPLAAVNVGLEAFAHSLKVQGASAIHVDWRPPAGGDERLMAILRRMKET